MLQTMLSVVSIEKRQATNYGPLSPWFLFLQLCVTCPHCDVSFTSLHFALYLRFPLSVPSLDDDDEVDEIEVRNSRPVSQSCAVAKSENVWRATWQSNLAYKRLAAAKDFHTHTTALSQWSSLPFCLPSLIVQFFTFGRCAWWYQQAEYPFLTVCNITFFPDISTLHRAIFVIPLSQSTIPKSLYHFYRLCSQCLLSTRDLSGRYGNVCLAAPGESGLSSIFYFCCCCCCYCSFFLSFRVSIVTHVFFL